MEPLQTLTPKRFHYTRKEPFLKLVILSRFCNGRVRHWAVMQDGKLLFKSDHKASCVRVLALLTQGNADE